MNGEFILCTSNKDQSQGLGMRVVDINTGLVHPGYTFKHSCIADTGAIANIGFGSSSYSGHGTCGDFIAVSQSNKPLIHIYQWGKAQVHAQCHMQEIVTALSCDSTGAFLFGGTKNGWMYCWDLSSGELLATWQAHFKGITKLSVSKDNVFCISVAEDGLGRAWDWTQLIDQSELLRNIGKIKPVAYRAWSPHRLPVKDLYLMDSLSFLKAVTCSLDRTVVVYDIHAGNFCMRISLPEPLLSITCNPNEDYLVTGSSTGDIFLVDLTLQAVAISAAHANVLITGSSGIKRSQEINSMSGSTSGIGNANSSTSASISGILEGHVRGVTSLSVSKDNCSLVSAGEDGSVRIWNLWTRQCLHQSQPMNKCNITNAMILSRPEFTETRVLKPAVFPMHHLAKYTKNAMPGVNNPNNNAIDAQNMQRDESYVLGPCFLSYQSSSTRNVSTEDSSSMYIDFAQLPEHKRLSSVSTIGKSSSSGSDGSASSKRERAELSEDYVPVAESVRSIHDQGTETEDGAPVPPSMLAAVSNTLKGQFKLQKKMDSKVAAAAASAAAKDGEETRTQRKRAKKRREYEAVAEEAALLDESNDLAEDESLQPVVKGKGVIINDVIGDSEDDGNLLFEGDAVVGEEDIGDDKATVQALHNKQGVTLGSQTKLKSKTQSKKRVVKKTR